MKILYGFSWDMEKLEFVNDLPHSYPRDTRLYGRPEHSFYQVAKEWKLECSPLPIEDDKKGSTVDVNRDRENASLNSNKKDFAILAIDFSKKINNLRTLIRSNALGFANNVLSPKRRIPLPGSPTTGLTPFL